MCRTGRLDDKKRCLCNDLHACVYAITFLQAFFSSSIYARDKFYVNFYVNYVWSTHFLSFHSGLVLLFLWKKTVIDCPKQSDADSIYPGTHFWLVAAAGMYSCPVATMFCEKLLTRRDIAENLENQERVLFGSDLVLLESWWVCYSVLSRKVMVHRKVRRIQRSLHANTVWREIHLEIVFYLLWKLLFQGKNVNFSLDSSFELFCQYFEICSEKETYNFRMPELSFRFHGASSGSYGIGPWEGKQIGKWRRAMKISWSHHLYWSIRGVLRVRIPKVRHC